MNAVKKREIKSAKHVLIITCFPFTICIRGFLSILSETGSVGVKAAMKVDNMNVTTDIRKYPTTNVAHIIQVGESILLLFHTIYNMFSYIPYL